MSFLGQLVTAFDGNLVWEITKIQRTLGNHGNNHEPQTQGNHEDYHEPLGSHRGYCKPLTLQGQPWK